MNNDYVSRLIVRTVSEIDGARLFVGDFFFTHFKQEQEVHSFADAICIVVTTAASRTMTMNTTTRTSMNDD